MGGTHSIQKLSFEDISDVVIKNRHAYILLNTLSPAEQDCLIAHTLTMSLEEHTINQLIATNKNHNIVIYGRNAGDPSVLRKYEQLNKLGFCNVLVYPGGLFEWLLLQEIYGSELFPTTCVVKDIYKFRAPKTLLLSNMLTHT